MNRLTRATLRTYAEGMNMDPKDITSWYENASQVQQQRALLQMRALERSWQEEVKLRAAAVGASWWSRLVARARETLRRWNEPYIP